MASKLTNTIETIKRIALTLPQESIEVANGEHTGSLHVATSSAELVKRAKRVGHEVSSFFTKEDFMCIIRDYFSDEYALADLAQWLTDYKTDYSRKTLQGCLFDKEVGIVAFPDGKVVNSSDYTIIVEKKDSCYRNTRTGLPFDIVTAFLEY